MSITTSIDRETASSLNPFIGTHSTEDSLDAVAGTLTELGCLLTSADSPEPSNLWWIFQSMACALTWESGNIQSIRQAQKESGHV